MTEVYTEIHFGCNSDELRKRELAAVGEEIIIGRVIVELAEKVDGVVGAFKQPVIRNDLYICSSKIRIKIRFRYKLYVYNKALIQE